MSIEGQGHFLSLAQGRVHTKIQIKFSQKLLCHSEPIFMKAFRYKEMKICYQDPGHMTKMAATPIYGKKTSKIFFSKTGWPISKKLGMLHRGLQPIIFCSNDDPGVTMAFFTARSNLEIWAFL